jgi:hypothetical protein
MKAVSIIAAVLLVAVNAAPLAPQAEAYQQYLPYLTYASIALGVVVLLAILATRASKPASVPVPAEAARPAPVPTRAASAEAEIVGLLATLQQKGRLVDFLMDDINPYSDAEVGAAARVVHGGCKAVLAEHFAIGPVRQENEGATVRVDAGYAADEYRLVGKIGGQAPFSGVLIHRGWKTDKVTLPRILRGDADRLPTIAPAEVELK